MSFLTVVFLPLLYGLVGFIEPCSLGINIIFLNRIKDFSRTKRMHHAILFTVVRAFFLALVGLTAAFIGQGFVTIQSNLFIALGIVYILLGTLSIINMYTPLITKDINLGQYVRNKSTLALGIVFGLIIPACAIAFVIALISQAVVFGNLLTGFFALFIFGLALSLPLVVLVYCERSTVIIQQLYEKVKRIRWLAGVILIIVGVLTLLSSVWWGGAL